MKLGGRVGFAKVEQLEERFQSIDFPIELALPWQYRELWLPIEQNIDQVIDFFRARGIEILTIHATQGPITDDSFLRWGALTLRIARALGVDDITIHPNFVRGQRAQNQERALRNLKGLGGSEVFSIETFGGKRRAFTPENLVEESLPMTLDIAHFRSRSQVLDIIERNHRNIRTVHLSAVGPEEHHLPVDDFCVLVLDELLRRRWSGNVILEYLPRHHYRVREDIEALSKYVLEGEPPSLLPASDEFKDCPDLWGYQPDGTS